MATGAAQDFEIPLRRPYAPLFVMVAVTLPLGLLPFLASPRRHQPWWGPGPVLGWVAIAFSAFFCLALFALAQKPRFSIVATMDALVLPPRFPWLGGPRAIAWRDLLRIATSERGHLLVQTERGRADVPAYWLKGKPRVAAAAQALDERMRLAHQRIGSSPQPRG